MRWLVATCLVAAVIEFTTGCSTTYQPPPPRQSRPPTARCLANPGETDTRPLFFLFCIESP